MTGTHLPVLLAEALAGLAVRADGIYLDATFGRGGHSRAILGCLGPEGRLLAMDRDPEAVAEGRRLAAEEPRFEMLAGPFSMLDEALKEKGLRGAVDGILLDLGVSSPQLDAPERGFSFLHDGPLDMRMDPHSGISAAEWLADAPEREIEQVLRVYGEERRARRIARALVQARARGPIQGTRQLADLIAAAAPRREPGRHPATRSFQAIRIHVNNELEEIDTALHTALEALKPGGRLAVIAFHSLEDRRVKRFIRRETRGGDLPKDLPVTADALTPRLRPIAGPIRPGAAEVAANPRARSALLRVAERRP